LASVLYQCEQGFDGLAGHPNGLAIPEKNLGGGVEHKLSKFVKTPIRQRFTARFYKFLIKILDAVHCAYALIVRRFSVAQQAMGFDAAMGRCGGMDFRCNTAPVWPIEV